ncbi:BspA family leucine-rich repeat surface protein, partial [Candidatus Saccharibacteria bacterium]|nr:BspA family leucine-rich repeat surface protein [Candidatus Saccharibacteria bacterium]
MKTKRLLLGTFIAGILAVIFGGGNTFATAGNTAEISGGKTWNICVDAGASYAGSDFVVNIAKTDFASQIVLGNGDCKSIEMTAGTYTASLNGTMGAGAVSYEITNDTVTFSVANSVRKYLNAFGSIAYTVEGSGEESPFELLFSMPGECQFNGNANVSGETCKDGEGNPLTNKNYIDTNVALFSEENAGRDFEVYFTLKDYATTQINQGTLFNAKYENSSMYYPGFTIRTFGTDGESLEITGRLGKDNTNADKAKNDITTADIKNKEVKIVRVGGMVSYSIDGGEMIPFQDYKNFSRYFNQTAVFGASMQTNGNPQRYYDGTIKDIRVYLKKVGSIEFDANGGTGTMDAIENKMIGTDVVLPANEFTKNKAVFTSWNTEADGSGVGYDDEATVTIVSENALILYAQWGDIPVGGVEFNANGGTGTMEAIDDIPVGEDATLPANVFTRTDFIFTSWNTEADGSGVDYADGATITIPSEGTLTLYAQWMELKGRIEFRANGGSGVMAAIDNITLGTEIALPANAFTLDNGTFLGWNTVADGSGVSYADGATVTISSAETLILYARWDNTNAETTLLGGQEVNIRIKTLTNDGSVTHYTQDTKIKNLNFVNYLPSTVGEDAPRVNIARDGEIPVYAYWAADDESVYIHTGASKIYAGRYSSRMFYNLDGLTSLTIPDYLDTSKVTDMSWMFFGMSSLTSLTLPSNFDTSKVTNMAHMFARLESLVSLVLPDSFDTSQVKDMSYMFDLENQDCALTSLTLPNSFDTSKVTNMTWMFHGLRRITSLTLPDSFNTSQVTDMSYMFSYAETLTSLTLPDSFDTSNVINMKRMFNGMTSLTSLTLPNSFNTSNVTDMSWMFEGMTSLTSLTLPNSFNTSNVTDMSWMFHGLRSITSFTLPNSFNTSNVTNMSMLFNEMSSLTSLTFPPNFNTSKVTNMNAVFANMYALTSLNLPASFDTSQVTYMSYMFSNLRSLTS